MNDPAQHLRLTESQAAGWDDRRWRWQVRDSGVLAQLGGQAGVLLMHCYALADLRTGECDLPRRHTAAELGWSPRTYDRALLQLIEAGVIECAGPSKTHPKVKRYRLLTPEQKPEAPGTPPGIAPADRGAGNVSDLTGGDRSVAQMVTNLSRDGDKSVTQKLPVKASPESSRSAGAPSEPAAPPAGTLWHRPAYDRAAAAALYEYGGLRWESAHGLVTQYRPTRRQALIVLANVYAWRRAARRGEAPPIRDLPALVRSELRKGKLSPDDRLHQERQRRRQARSTQRRPETAGDPIDALTEAQRQALADRALAGLRAQSRDAIERLPAERRTRRIRELMREQIKKEGDA